VWCRTCLWSWIPHVLKIEEQTIYDTAGLDSLYFDRANRLCLIIAAFVAVLNLGVVLVSTTCFLCYILQLCGCTRPCYLVFTERFFPFLCCSL